MHAKHKLPPRTSPVPGPPPLRSDRPGERKPGCCRPPSHPETSAKFESQDARPAFAHRPGHSVDAPSRLRPSRRSLSTALPAFQRVIKCISGVKNLGPGGSWKPSPLRDQGRGQAQRSQRAGGLCPGCAARPLTALGNRCEPMRQRPARFAFPPPVRSCRRGPPPRPPRPGVTLRPRWLPGLQPGSGLGSGPSATQKRRPRKEPESRELD